MKSRLDLGFVAQPRNRPLTSSCCSCYHAARTRPRWPPGPSNEAYLSSPHLEASPATTFRACSSPAPQSSRNLHLQYSAKNQSTQRCQSLITQGSDHPPVLEPHMVLKGASSNSERNRGQGPTCKRGEDLEDAGSNTGRRRPRTGPGWAQAGRTRPAGTACSGAQSASPLT
jgi:hypothetical protein